MKSRLFCLILSPRRGGGGGEEVWILYFKCKTKGGEVSCKAGMYFRILDIQFI